MFGRRTRARVELLFATVVLLPLQVYLGRYLGNERDGSRILTPGLVAGALWSCLTLSLGDRDVGSVRTNRRRKLLFRFGTGTVASSSSLVSRTFQRDFSTGQTIGLIGYRVWYGLLRPLPGPEE